jgi:hypothetical protein
MNRLIATQQQGIAATIENLQRFNDRKELTKVAQVSIPGAGAPPPPRRHAMMKRLLTQSSATVLLAVLSSGCVNLDRAYPEKRFFV